MAKTPGAAPAADTEKKEKSYVVKVGSLIVGEHEKRSVGQQVKASELTKKELRTFLGDGTIEEAK